MIREEIEKLMAGKQFPDACDTPELIETHISWVILCNALVYKIKKPVRYPFLDFSTIEKRKFYCQREVELNSRHTQKMYLDVLPVRRHAEKIFIEEEGSSEVMDYAVRMKRMDSSKQMNRLLEKKLVNEGHMRSLAETISDFHKKADIICKKNPLDVKGEFNALASEVDETALEAEQRNIMQRAVESSDRFVETNKTLLQERLIQGFFRDVHGDLHSRNIFLLPSPVIFDCIEFNDSFRQIDILNELAFLCMDLEAAGNEHLSKTFISHYNSLFPAIRTEAEAMLFTYYKGYRASVRAKVNFLRARSAQNEFVKTKALQDMRKYFKLMDKYIRAVRM